MKKICFFSGDITRSGGTERVGTVIANELHRRGQFNISIVSLWEKEKNTFFFLENGVKRYTLFPHPVSGKRILTYIKEIRKFVNKNNIDVLVDIDGILDLYSITALKKSKCKLVSWEQFNYYVNPNVKYRKIARKMAAKKADAIVVLTDEDKGFYEKETEINTRLVRIYNPIPRKNENATYNLDSKTIISVGRYTEQKGFDMLIDVAKRVFDKHKDWKWLVIGDGDDKDILKEKIAKYKLEKNVILKKNVDDINEYYRKSAMYVLTSRYEGFGLVLTEAKTQGLPCISFNCPAGPKEIIIDGVNGYLVDCFDIDQMAGKINELIENENKRKLFSENALVGTEKFEIENIVTQWSELLKELTRKQS